MSAERQRFGNHIMAVMARDLDPKKILSIVLSWEFF